MQRLASEALVQWRAKAVRKPLVLLGARQVGKTYLLKEFGAKHFRNCVHLNFESDESLMKIFDGDLDPVRIIQDLAMSGYRVVEGETLLVFDEIQNCGRALTSLKYFCERLPNLHVCAAGSLLGLFLAEASFPVGKVEFLPMFPLTFGEFLMAVEANELLAVIEGFIHERGSITSHQHRLLFDLFKEYLIVGGLPEVVVHFAQNRLQIAKSFDSVRDIQSQLIINYVADMAKHSGKINSMHIERLWHHSAMQLAKTDLQGASKFKFKGVVPNVRGYERLAGVLDWLVKAGLTLQLSICNASFQPLRAFTKDSIFKLYVFDVGILGAMSRLQASSVYAYDFGMYKGYLAENFVLQEIHAAGDSVVSWSEGTSEIEFLLESGTHIVPIEVKAGVSTKAKSLKVYRDKYRPEIALKVSGSHVETLKLKEGVVNVPLYAAGWVKHIIKNFI